MSGVRVWGCAIALVVAFAGGCKTQSQPPPPPRKPPRASVVLRFRAAPDMNPNDRGESTPVDVRVYQLKDRVAFTEAAFEELWTDATRLGASALGEPKVFTFEPQAADAAPLAHELKLDPTTQFLGIMGLFSAERKEGLEERKLCVSVDEAAMKIVGLTGHTVRIEDPLQ
jgi:type VI secretion system VasD/TssJ family lipoprotein